MSCGHDGCICGPDQTDEHRHPQQHEDDLPVASETNGAGGCCGGGHHGDHASDRREGAVAADH